jgi:polyisoprenoid-binding protein YceI
LFVAAIALTACGLLREPEEASAPIEAVPIEVTTTAAPAEEQPAYPAPAGDSEAEAAYPATAEESPIAAYPAAGAAGSGELRVYTISQADSEVRFQLDEDLRGQRNTVIGVTDQVAGEIAVDLADLSTAQVGLIQINARTLATDNNFRNRAIQNEILDTGNYEFITFSPTSIEGLPASVTVGQSVDFVLAGDLTIRDVTTPVQFSVTATAVTQDQITGTATATITRADYGIRIPSVPNVANVEDEVDLYIDFVANLK